MGPRAQVDSDKDMGAVLLCPVAICLPPAPTSPLTSQAFQRKHGKAFGSSRGPGSQSGGEREARLLLCLPVDGHSSYPWEIGTGTVWGTIWVLCGHSPIHPPNRPPNSLPVR